MRETIKRKRKKRQMIRIGLKALLCVVLLGVLAGFCMAGRELQRMYHLPEDEYPGELVELLENNPETKAFVMDYPTEKNKKHNMDLSEYEGCGEVPHFLQWDKRWGYESYGNSMIGINGCGPTCLSMVAVYLLQDTTLNPKWMADYSMEHGYYQSGSGTAWVFMSDGAREIGLNAKEIPLDEQRIIDNLVVGNPIICSMGPGDFTTAGHYIVLVGYEDGKILVNDPNSKKRTEKKWEFDEIQGQIKNLWVYWK